jgi:hypothetical protein
MIETNLERWRRYQKEHPESNQAPYPPHLPESVGRAVEQSVLDLKQEQDWIKRNTGAPSLLIAAVIDRLDGIFYGGNNEKNEF